MLRTVSFRHTSCRSRWRVHFSIKLLGYICSRFKLNRTKGKYVFTADTEATAQVSCVDICAADPKFRFPVTESLDNITKTCPFKYTEHLTTKNENFQIKNSDIFHTSAQNTDCGYSFEPPRHGGSNEYSQSMFLRRNMKKKNVYPCLSQLYYIKVGLRGSNLYRHVFVIM